MPLSWVLHGKQDMIGLLFSKQLLTMFLHSYLSLFRRNSQTGKYEKIAFKLENSLSTTFLFD